MSHGDRTEQIQPRPLEYVSESAGDGNIHATLGRERRPNEGTSTTFTDHDAQWKESGVRSYVLEIDRLIALFHSGE